MIQREETETIQREGVHYPAGKYVGLGAVYTGVVVVGEHIHVRA